MLSSWHILSHGPERISESCLKTLCCTLCKSVFFNWSNLLSRLEKTEWSERKKKTQKSCWIVSWDGRRGRFSLNFVSHVVKNRNWYCSWAFQATHIWEKESNSKVTAIVYHSQFWKLFVRYIMAMKILPKNNVRTIGFCKLYMKPMVSYEKLHHPDCFKHYIA